MRLLELAIHAILMVALAYSLLVQWGFETQHFIMIAEGRIPKRIQAFNPSKGVVDKLTDSSNKSIKTPDSKTSEFNSSQSLGSSQGATNSTTTSEAPLKVGESKLTVISEKAVNSSTGMTSSVNQEESL